MTIYINGNDLTIEDVALVARFNERASLTEEAVANMQKSRDYVEKKLKEGAIIYGLTTGFGNFSDTYISADDAPALQNNLIISHSCALGKPLDTQIVRAMMLLRCNALAKGNSGIRVSTVETLLKMLNRGVHPIIPSQGSLGASGDLALLAHMVLPMLGEGLAEYKGDIMPGREAMRRAGLPVIQLTAKEGLALINGTQVMTAIGALALYDAEDLLKTADIAAAMTCEALLGIKAAYDPKVHALRGHAGQSDSAANLLKLLEGSQLAQRTQPGRVQDAYSLRCVPQIHGGSREAIAYVHGVIAREINAVTDNPLIFPDEDQVISGGNFHGQPVAIAMDTLKIALAELADVSGCRIERMVNPHINSGLPAFLIESGGVNSGFMITQYAAASIVSENKVLAHPASVDSIPSSANQEDHVSMGTTAARQAWEILGNVQKVLGIELFAATQAIWMRGEDKLAPATRGVYDMVRKEVFPITKDVVMHEEMVKFQKMVSEHRVSAAAESVCGKLS